MKRLFVVLCAVVAVAQCGVPLALIARYENVLRTGTALRVPLRGFDPSDPFRGRYVAIRPQLAVAESLRPVFKNMPDDGRFWATLRADAAGLAQVTALSKDRPDDALAVEVSKSGGWAWAENLPETQEAARSMSVGLRIDRYYVNESQAAQADAALARATRRTAGDAPPGDRAFALVRVKDNLAMIEGITVDGAPLETR